MQYIGIDGCKIGWFYVAQNDSDGWEIGIVNNISELSQKIQISKQTLIDIPIGLREKEKHERQCDKAARKILGQRRSSVFPAPSRLAINCSHYEEGSNVNFQATGRRLTKQSWAIVSKINEIDLFLRNTGLSSKVREIHPEVCFWALNGRKEMSHAKKEAEGIRQRIELLSKFCSQTENIFQNALGRYQRNEVARDDIVDAIAGVVTARFFNKIETLPPIPEIDAQGLPMEMVYPKI